MCINEGDLEIEQSMSGFMLECIFKWQKRMTSLIHLRMIWDISLIHIYKYLLILLSFIPYFFYLNLIIFILFENLYPEFYAKKMIKNYFFYFKNVLKMKCLMKYSMKFLFKKQQIFMNFEDT